MLRKIFLYLARTGFEYGSLFACFDGEYFASRCSSTAAADAAFLDAAAGFFAAGVFFALVASAFVAFAFDDPLVFAMVEVVD